MKVSLTPLAKPTITEVAMNKFMRMMLPALLLALTPLAAQADTVFAHGIATNATVDATNTQWSTSFAFNSIGFINDSTNVLYITPSGTNLFFVVCTNSLLTSVNNYRDPISGTNISSTSITGSVTKCATNFIGALTAGKGWRLNANGGNVVFNGTGRPGVNTFQFISGFGNGNNLCIAIGTTDAQSTKE